MKLFKTIQLILLISLLQSFFVTANAEDYNDTFAKEYSVVFKKYLGNYNVTFYHNDAFNSPIAATDKYGNVLWKERYAPFGEPQLNDAAKNPHPVDYTGHVYDKELGLHYMGARYYDPILGRFMSNDPVGFYESNPMSFNRYAYANNNPYRYMDPDGRVPVDTIWDFGNIVYDIGKISVGWTIGDQRMVVEGGRDLLLDVAAFAVPYVPAGLTKIDDAAEVAKKTPSGGSPALKGDAYHPDTVAARQADNRKLYGGFDPKGAAKDLGYGNRIASQKAPFNSHGQPVFSNGKGYISPDVDGHNVTNGWKMFDRKGRRTGTWSTDLTKRLKD